MYPITIFDNFFPEPDKIVDFALSLEYSDLDDPSWPGKRSKALHELNPRLFNYVGNRIHKIFYDSQLPWVMDIRFQLIEPFCEDQYDPKNRGWIHADYKNSFGGLIFLNKNPEKDTGTSLYREKDGYSYMISESVKVKEKFYRGEKVNDEQYYKAFDDIHSQFEETVKIENVYNRLLMFNSDQYHAAKTYGKNQKRLTMVFFSYGLGNCAEPLPPLCRLT